jgi:hypothetical protein
MSVALHCGLEEGLLLDCQGSAREVVDFSRQRRSRNYNVYSDSHHKWRLLGIINLAGR